jgi:hypothetical protein
MKPVYAVWFWRKAFKFPLAIFALVVLLFLAIMEIESQREELRRARTTAQVEHFYYEMCVHSLVVHDRVQGDEP